MKATEVKRYKCAKCSRENKSKEKADKCCTELSCSCGRGTYIYIPGVFSQKCWICEREEEKRKEEEEFRAFNRAWH
ncbi:MAG: hypothetical protein H2212_07195 [Ruminococcus sp.]|nr:hypothetical protein [Ruminococcus sp.]